MLRWRVVSVIGTSIFFCHCGRGYHHSFGNTRRKSSLFTALSTSTRRRCGGSNTIDTVTQDRVISTPLSSTLALGPVQCLPLSRNVAPATAAFGPPDRRSTKTTADRSVPKIRWCWGRLCLAVTGFCCRAGYESRRREVGASFLQRTPGVRWCFGGLPRPMIG